AVPRSGGGRLPPGGGGGHLGGRAGPGSRARRGPVGDPGPGADSGAGRLGRRFVSPPGGALALTVAHRSAVPPAARSWFPLAAGLAVIDTLSAVLGPEIGRASCRDRA